MALVCHSLAACQRHTPSPLAAVIGGFAHPIMASCLYVPCVAHVPCVAWDGNPALDYCSWSVWRTERSRRRGTLLVKTQALVTSTSAVLPPSAGRLTLYTLHSSCVRTLCVPRQSSQTWHVTWRVMLEYAD